MYKNYAIWKLDAYGSGFSASVHRRVSYRRIAAFPVFNG